jgi:hypothetical protein
VLTIGVTLAFGWVLLEDQNTVVDWGMASAQGPRRARLITRFERIVNRYRPSVFVLEKFEGNGLRAERIQSLCREMTHLALLHGIDAVVYPRDKVQSVFGRAGAMTRHEVARAIAERLTALSHRLPNKRRRWEPEDARQSLFDAAALALTYYALFDRD